MRFGDFPAGTDFTCIDVIDQCGLFVAEVGIKEPDVFSEKHMHIAVRLAELIELDERGFMEGIDFDEALSVDQIHWKRTLGPEIWEKLRAGEFVWGTQVDGAFRPIPIPLDQEPWDEWDEPWMTNPRIPERMAMYHGTQIRLAPAARPEIEQIGRQTLRIPPSVQDRITLVLGRGLFDSAIRDLGAALETRMRLVAGTNDFGMRLVDRYIEVLLRSGQYLPARVKALRQELRSIFKFVRNEFAHKLVDVDASRGYALVSRMCWHLEDVEIVADQMAT